MRGTRPGRLREDEASGVARTRAHGAGRRRRGGDDRRRGRRRAGARHGGDGRAREARAPARVRCRRRRRRARRLARGGEGAEVGRPEGTVDVSYISARGGAARARRWRRTWGSRSGVKVLRRPHSQLARVGSPLGPPNNFLKDAAARPPLPRYGARNLTHAARPPLPPYGARTSPAQKRRPSERTASGTPPATQFPRRARSWLPRRASTTPRCVACCRGGPGYHAGIGGQLACPQTCFTCDPQHPPRHRVKLAARRSLRHHYVLLATAVSSRDTHVATVVEAMTATCRLGFARGVLNLFDADPLPVRADATRIRTTTVRLQAALWKAEPRPRSPRSRTSSCTPGPEIHPQHFRCGMLG